MSFHLYNIIEIYSNDSGTMQYIELSVGGNNNENQWGGENIRVIQGGVTINTLVFDADLPSTQTANTHVLIATQAFQDAHNIDADFTIPAGFLLLTGGTVTINFGSNSSVVTYNPATLLGTSDTQSLNGSGSTMSTAAAASPENFAGDTVNLGDPDVDPTGTVTITGTATENQTLTADASSIQDENGLGTFTYTWLRNGSTIPGSNSTQYTLTDADVGATIRVRVSYTDQDGYAETVTSSATSVVANVNDSPTGAVTITGSATEGQTLTANTSAVDDDDGLGAFSYVWLRGDAAIGGATSSSYMLTSADVGFAIRVRVTYTDDHGTQEELTSSATATVSNTNSPPTGAVVITGTAAIGEVLTADTSALADADGLGDFSYQWLRDGEAIGGADDASYQVAEQDGGHRISVRVSYEDDEGTDESVTSEETDEVAEEVNSILGTAGDDDIVGTAGVDAINALAGNDTIDGAGGNDTVSGGSGTDTVVIDSNVSGVTDYSIVGIQVSVTTAMGRVVMNDVERVLFDDVLVAFDTEEGEPVWQASALLWAAFGSAPSTALLSEWTAEADVHAGDMHDLAGHLIEQYAPGVSSEVLVTHLFGTLLGIAPTQDQVDHFAGMIGEGEAFEDNAAFLAFAAELEINTDRMAGFAGSIQFLDPSYF